MPKLIDPTEPVRPVNCPVCGETFIPKSMIFALNETRKYIDHLYGHEQTKHHARKLEDMMKEKLEPKFRAMFPTVK